MEALVKMLAAYQRVRFPYTTEDSSIVQYPCLFGFFFFISTFFFSLIHLENWSWVNNFLENPLREENVRKEKSTFS